MTLLRAQLSRGLARRVACLLPPLLLGMVACNPDKDLLEEKRGSGETGETDVEDSETEETDSGDTGDTSHTGDTGDTAETGETGDTGETDTAEELRATSITLSPASMSVNPGASYPIEAVVRWSDGSITGGESLAWTVDDPKIATVDASGEVTATVGGATTIRGTAGFVEGTASLVVTEGALFYVTVINSVDGTPIEGATVEVDGGDSVLTDAAGYAEVAAPGPGAESITALVDDSYSAVTYLDLTSRVLTMPLTPKDTVSAGTLSGSVDFGAVTDADATELVVGLVPHTIQGSLATMLLADLFGPDHTVSIYGNDVDLPANVLLEGTVEDYTIDADPGMVGAWGFAGPVSIRDVSAAAGGVGEALALLLDYMPTMTWGWAGGATLTTGGAATLDLAPTLPFSSSETITLPALPVGFRGDEEILAFVAEECRDEGWVVTGMGSGTTTAEVAVVPAGSVTCTTRSGVYIYAEVGGAGSGGASTACQGSVDRTGAWVLPDLQDAPSIDAWDPATRALQFTVDGNADFVRVRMEDDRYNVHDYYTRASWSGTVPADFSQFRRAQADVEVWSLDLTSGTTEEQLAGGDLDGRYFPVLTSARAAEVN